MYLDTSVRGVAAFVSNARRDGRMNYGHVVECGDVAPLFDTNRKIVFNAGPSIFCLHAADNSVATRANASTLKPR